MTASKKHILAALILSTALILINIIAVTSGSADNVYSEFEQLLKNNY